MLTLLGFWELMMLQPVTNPAPHQSASQWGANPSLSAAMFGCINRLSAVFNHHPQSNIQCSELNVLAAHAAQLRTSCDEKLTIFWCQWVLDLILRAEVDEHVHTRREQEHRVDVIHACVGASISSSSLPPPSASSKSSISLIIFKIGGPPRNISSFVIIHWLGTHGLSSTSSTWSDGIGDGDPVGGGVGLRK